MQSSLQEKTQVHRSVWFVASNPCRVFVLADPDVLSGPVGQVLSSDIEASSSGELPEPLDHMRCAVQHALQAVLGAEQCHGKKLDQALGVSEAVLFFMSPPGGVWGVSPALRVAQRSLSVGLLLPSRGAFRHAVFQLERSCFTASPLFRQMLPNVTRCPWYKPSGTLAYVRGAFI